MKSLYSVTEAQRDLPKMLRNLPRSGVTTITRRDTVAAYVISPERWEGLLETMELLANPDFQVQLKKIREGKVSYFSLDDLPE